MSSETATQDRSEARAAGRDAWQPEIHPACGEQSRRIVAALRARLRPEVVIDALASQVEELARVRDPASRLAGAALAEAAWRVRGGVPLDEFGVWVHYPWSGRLVKVLPPEPFRELRLSRNRNKITLAEQAVLQRLRIGIVGLSVGQASAVTLAMEGVGGVFRLADFDALSLSNLNRVRAGVHDLGVNKAVLTARALLEIDPFLEVQVFDRGVDDASVDRFLTGDGALDVLLEECDDLCMKLRLRERARELRMPVLMETSDRGMLDVERFDLEADRPLLHGLVEGMGSTTLRRLSAEDRLAVALRMVGPETLSPRAAASALEVGTTLESWPQLASAISLGAALNTDAVRRIALGSFRASGRFHVDLEQIVTDPAAAVATSVVSVALPGEALARTRGSVDEVVRELVAHAVRAPSGGNAQPWRFFWNGRRLRLCIDPVRAGSLLDHGLRATCLALGAATENLVLAAQARGLRIEVEPFPDACDPQVVCDFRWSRDARPAPVDPLHAFVDGRCTNRRLGSGQALPEGAGRRLIDEASASGARLLLVEAPAARARLGEVLGRGDRWRYLSEPLHAEFMRELRWNEADAERTRDGIDLRTLELATADLAGLHIARSWSAMSLVAAVGGGRKFEAFARRAAAGAAAFGLLSTEGDAPQDFFRAGRAMQRVWLAATQVGLGVQPMAALAYVAAAARSGEGPWDAAQRASLAAIERDYRALLPLSDRHRERLLFRFTVVDPPTVRALRRDVDAVLTLD